MRFLLRNFSKLINIGRRNIYRWNSANFHRLLIASMYKFVCIHRVLMLTLRFPPFCCLSYQWSISRIVTLRIVTRFIGLSSPFSRRFPVRSFSFDVNTKILKYVFLRRRRSEDLTTSLREIIIFLFLPQRFPLFLLFSGLPPNTWMVISLYGSHEEV